MKILYIFATSFLMLFASDASSSIHIKLTPIAVNADRVLFTTQKYESRVGVVRPCAKADFGWLVVSAAGVWDERHTYNYDCKKENEGVYEKYLQGKVTVKNPDKTLRKLMKKYEFYEYSVLENEPYVYAIKPKQSCFKGECLEKSTKQKTLGKLVSTKLHSSIRSSFYYKGVALFHNVKEDYMPSYPEPAIKKKNAKGASFRLNAQEVYATSYIDGLVLFDSYAFTQPSKETKKEVEAVVKEMFYLFNAKKLKVFNTRFIHPKYGFYDMYNPGIWMHFKHHAQLEKDSSKYGNNPYSKLFNAKNLSKKVRWEETYFSCEYGDWNKRGVFINESSGNYVQHVIEDVKKGVLNLSISPEDEQRARFLIENVFVIVDTIQDITFYIKKIDGKWYLTHIDRVSLCDA